MSDVLATLRSALAPKAGMKRIPIPLESYEHPSLPFTAKRLLNLYSEAGQSDARSLALLMPSGGLETYKTLGDGPVRAINDDFPGYIYVVSGDHLYRIAQF